MTARFVPDKAGLAALARTVEMVEILDELGGELAEAASASVPVLTGDLAAGYGSEAGVEDGIATARVAGDDFKSGFYEFGTENTPAIAPLRRAAESLGLEVEAE